VINKEETIKAAYLFYYASETAFSESPNVKKELKVRLNALMHDALIVAKKVFLSPKSFSRPHFLMGNVK
jgi:glycylpeptide N-tetradecanoyltransferase